MKGTIEVLTNASKAIAIANFNAGGAVQMLGIQYLRVDINPGSEKFGRPAYQNDFGNSDRIKREYRQYRTWVEAGKWGGGSAPPPTPLPSQPRSGIANIPVCTGRNHRNRFGT